MEQKRESKGFDVVITGSGLGGLMCGALLSLNGYKTLILEKHHQIGGNLQSFKRKGVKFNSAMHFVGAMEKGQILHQVFQYLGILEDTGLERLDRKHYERLFLGEKEFHYASGMEAHREGLLSYFPAEGKAIDAYLDMMVEIWNSTKVLNLKDFRNHMDADTRFTQMDAYEFIDSLTDNQDLRALWGMTSALHAGEPGKTPLLTHAIISYHYIQGAWKFRNGSDRLAKALMQVIRGNGGALWKNSEVVGMHAEGRRVKAVELSDGSIVEGSHFISGLHPAQTIRLLEPGAFRKAYVKRVQSLENTIGSFCLYIILKKGTFRSINSNVNIANGKDAWNPGRYYEQAWPAGCILYTTPDKTNPEFAESMTISAFMKYEELKKWEDTRVGRRGSHYKAFKQERAEQLIALAASRLEGLQDSVEQYYSATPLTFRDYTASPGGSLYGIIKDCRNPRESYISPNTRMENLFLTGQSSGVGLHGVLGVTVSALFTCEALLDIEKLLNEIKDA